MADILCGYTADRDETLVAYLYDDIDEGQRATFEAHIATCERCRHELAELQGVRGRLREWTTPEPLSPLAVIAPSAVAAAPAPRVPAVPVWRGIPAWAQVAAALLVLGVSAGIANLDVHYDRTGLSVRTGWSRSAVSAPPQSSPATPAQGVATATPWNADLSALERRLRTELATTRDDRSANADAAQLLRKVHALLDDSERRQRNEVALQIAQVVREFDTKRGSDLANLRTLKNVQNVTDVRIERQQQWLDLLTRASVQK
jgi:hypothetical protein